MVQQTFPSGAATALLLKWAPSLEILSYWSFAGITCLLKSRPLADAKTTD
jgi:hypothetical protein